MIKEVVERQEDKLSEIDIAIFLTRGFKKLPKGQHRWVGYLLENDLCVESIWT